MTLPEYIPVTLWYSTFGTQVIFRIDLSLDASQVQRYNPVIGQYWSRDWDSCLLLANGGHLTVVVAYELW